MFLRFNQLACGSLCVFLCSASFCRADETNALSLSQAVERALRFNLGLAIQRYGPQQAREDLTISRSAFDPSLGADGQAGENRSASAASELDGSEQPISQQQSAQASVSKKTALGAQVSLEGQLNRSESDSSYAKLNPVFNTEAGVSIRQPILKGWGPSANLLAVRLGEIAVARADLNLRSQVLDVVRDTEKAYWDLVYARAAKTVKLAALEQAQRLAKEAEARRKAGLATEVDVVEAQAEKASCEEDLLLADQVILNTADRLAVLLGRLNAQTAAPATDEDLSAASLPERFDVDTSLATARAQQPEYLAQAEAIRGQRLEVDAARRNNRPTLDLSGHAGYAGQSDSASDAFDSMVNGDGYQWRAGLEFSMPWGRREDRARLQKSYFSLAAETLRLDQLDQDLVLQVRGAVREADIARQRRQAAGLTRELRERQTALMQARFSAGSATLRDTISAQNELENARLRELKARLDRIVAATDLARIEGSLLTRHGLQWSDAEQPAGSDPIAPQEHP